MKIQYIFSLIVLLVVCGSSQNIHAEDFEFKTTLMKEVTKQTLARNVPACGTGTATVIPSQPYTAVEIMQENVDFTRVSFRVFYSDDLSTPLYNYLDKTATDINFNSTSGEIRFVMTGIAQTRKELTVRVYLNNDGTGAPFEEKIFFTSQAKTGPPVGSIMPFYGTATAARALRLGGWYLCDGSIIDTIDANVLFPDEKTALKAVVGNNLPDLRGVFLRGIDPAGTYDPSANRAPGDLQTSQIQGHSHNYDRASDATEIANANVGLSTSTGACEAGPFAVLVPTATTTGGNHSHNINHTVTATNSAGIGNDTRPVNKAVNYLIKVRH